MSALSDIGELDLGLLKAAEDTLADLASLEATVLELRERLWADRLTSAEQLDLSRDLYAQTSRLQGFALRMMCGVKA